MIIAELKKLKKQPCYEFQFDPLAAGANNGLEHDIMKIFIRIVTVLAFVAWSSAGNATMITQQTDFNFSAGPVSGTGNLNVVNANDFTASVSPFDTSLGTLVSFTVDWFITFTTNGTVPDSGTAGGGSSGSSGGSYSIAGSSYAGNGSGSGNGGGPGAVISTMFSVMDIATFFPSQAGLTYDPAILAAVIGGSDFDLVWDATYSPSYNNLNNFTGNATGRVILTYDYRADIPTPSTLALLGLGLAGFGWSRRKKV